MHLRMLNCVEKPFQRMEHWIIVIITFEIYCSNDILLVKMTTICKMIVFNNARNWTGTKLGNWLEHLFLSFLYGIFIVLYIKPYSFLSLLIPSSATVVSRPRPKTQGHSFFRYHNFVGSTLWIRARVLDIRWIGLLGLSGPNKLSMPQTTRSRNVFRFHGFIGFIS